MLEVSATKLGLKNDHISQIKIVTESCGCVAYFSVLL